MSPFVQAWGTELAFEEVTLGQVQGERGYLCTEKNEASKSIVGRPTGICVGRGPR